METKYCIPKLVEVSKEEYESYGQQEVMQRQFEYVGFWGSFANSVLTFIR